LPSVFPKLGDAGCVCYVSYNRFPHIQALKKSSLHASIVPKLCIRIEHSYRDCHLVDPISKFSLAGFMTVWNWHKMDLELLTIFSSSFPDTFFAPHFKCFYISDLECNLLYMFLTLIPRTLFYKFQNIIFEKLRFYDIFGLISSAFHLSDPYETCCTCL